MNKLSHGQSLVDRMMAAKHTIAGQDLAKAIHKATTEEVMGPKRKHLDYLIWCSNNQNVSIPEMANTLLSRTTNSNWVVVFKALITVHDLMNYGNERFSQYMASSSFAFNLDSFFDRTDGMAFAMSNFVRRYARYVNEKALNYRQMGYDFCKVRRGQKDGFFRTLDTDKLLKALPILQNQLDILLAFDAAPSDLSNGVISVCFLALFKDLVRLFACYNDGIINLLERYFDMERRHCHTALDIYKKFIVRMECVRAFLQIAETMGMDRREIPDLAKAPSSLCDALEDHLKALESNKKSGVSAPAPKPNAGVSTAISKFAAAAQIGVAPGAGAAGTMVITDDERKKILEEEQKQLDLLKKSKPSQISSREPTVPSVVASSQPMAAPRSVTTSNTQFSTPPVAAPRSGLPTNMQFSTSFDDTDTPRNVQALGSMPVAPSSKSEEIPSAQTFSSPPPGFNNFDELLQPTIMHSTPNTLDLSNLSLSPTKPIQSRPQMMFSPGTQTVSPAIVIPISPLNIHYGMPGMSSTMYPTAVNPYWMQPRYMMTTGQPGMGWPTQTQNYISPQPPPVIRPQPNDPFGAL